MEWEGRNLLSILVDAQGIPSPDSQKPSPEFPPCIHPDEPLPRLGCGTGAAGSHWEAHSGGFLSITEVLLPPISSAAAPHGMCIRFPASPSGMQPCWGILGGREHVLAVCEKASTPPQIPTELQSSSALVWVKEN